MQVTKVKKGLWFLLKVLQILATMKPCVLVIQFICLASSESIYNDIPTAKWIIANMNVSALLSISLYLLKLVLVHDIYIIYMAAEFWRVSEAQQVLEHSR